ncbi:MAG: hypothetical protein GOMPHAMPRED_000832 [Gomphillus americanus]|uniref:DUF7907 domain-containing protein n=1 Tax=Gomphillus americanus TaxID=1940652 RepID=A0A8H3IHC1_9LECA|nr:MAG: hypothetical protein GOMPHAMPRED_000832 [Gomphillus americanus]
MQFTAILLGTITTLSSLASAQYTNRSHAFNLVVESSTNKTLSGTRLTACHSGAAIETLCTYPAASDSISDEFYYNYTTQSKPTSGIITWNLPYNGNQIESEPLTFQYDPSTNVALPVFIPSEDNEVFVTFDKNNYLLVLSYLDDTKTPPGYKPQQLSRWQVCQTYYGSYTYTTLAWTLGSGKPQNPSCQAVKVKRVAITKS